jgi:hypothetical protein
MLFGRCKRAQSRSTYRIPSRLDIHFIPQPAKILGLVIHNREHAAKEEEIAGLHRLNVTAKRRRSRWKLDAEVL